jgi:hypothetical protein
VSAFDCGKMPKMGYMEILNLNKLCIVFGIGSCLFQLKGLLAKLALNMNAL